MKDQVTSLPVSKELAELMPGVETAFSWCIDLDEEADGYSLHDNYRWIARDYECYEYVPAYTLTEILRVLPPMIEFKSCSLTDCTFNKPAFRCGLRGYLEIHFESDRSGVDIIYNCEMERRDLISFTADQKVSIEDAAAKLCIWTIKEGYLKITDGGG
jgi:hypothetical protein